ncbi:MAG: TolC family protein [Syntrophales bacterium]|nr:TolC family protein [Syntrophales bacterium]
MKRRTLLVILILAGFHAEVIHSQPLTLSEGLRLATENNRLVRIARQEETIAKSDSLIARAPMLPTLNATFYQTFLAIEPKAVFGTQTVPVSRKDFYDYSLTVQQTLWDFKGNASRYGASKMILESKKFDTARIRNLVAFNFTLSYLDLLQAEKIVQVAEDEVKRLESHLKDATNLYEQGVITKNDLLQAQVRISDAKQRRIDAKNMMDISVSIINNIMAKPLKTEITPVEVAETEALPPAAKHDLNQAWEMAENNRPEMKIVDATLKSLGLERESVKSDYYPKIFAGGSYDYLQNPYQTPNGNWSLVFGLRFNIFSGGATSAQLSKISGQNLQLLEQREKIADDIRLEVERYILNLEAGREKLAVTKGAVDQAQENVRINKVKYSDGVGTASDVLDALTLLTVAETNYYRAIYDLRKAEAGALYSEGKDLSEVYK